MDNHEQQQATWGGDTGHTSGRDHDLDDAMSRFDSMSINSSNMQQQQLGLASEAHGRYVAGPNELSVGSLSIGEATATQQSFAIQQQQQQQASAQSRSLHCAPSSWGAHQDDEGLMVQPQQHNLGGGAHKNGCICCASCSTGRTAAAPGSAATVGGRGQDGVWRDEHGRRLYSEDEMRKALEREGAGWRDRAASLEASLAKMDSDAREALRRAEEALSDMAEQLRASEGKTYALSVHLARSNRPSHLA